MLYFSEFRRFSSSSRDPLDEIQVAITDDEDTRTESPISIKAKGKQFPGITRHLQKTKGTNL